MDSHFWANKRVLLTGHTGFKGSWLALWLASKGAQVTGFGLAPPTNPNLYHLADVKRDIDSIEGDIRDISMVDQAVARSDPQIVLHLAAQSLVRPSYDNPIETFDTNVMGTANLLHSLRQANNLQAVVVVTSDKCYDNREWLWGYREDEAMGGSDPYSASKGCTELVTASFRQSYYQHSPTIGLATARAGNVIGGGDFAIDRLITDIMKAIREGKPAQIRNPNAIRPWQHVLEPLHGYLLLVEALVRDPQTYSAGWNFGPHDSDARPVSWICNELTKRWGDSASWHTDDRDHPHEATYLKLDSSKARAQLQWRSKLTLDSTLDRIVQWNRVSLDSGNIREHTLSEIAEYERL